MFFLLYKDILTILVLNKLQPNPIQHWLSGPHCIQQARGLLGIREHLFTYPVSSPSLPNWATWIWVRDNAGTNPWSPVLEEKAWEGGYSGGILSLYPPPAEKHSSPPLRLTEQLWWQQHRPFCWHSLLPKLSKSILWAFQTAGAGTGSSLPVLANFRIGPQVFQLKSQQISLDF